MMQENTVGRGGTRNRGEVKRRERKETSRRIHRASAENSHVESTSFVHAVVNTSDHLQ
jgi:hypothetical protein